MNEITIHGNLTDEPTLRYRPSGIPVVSFSVAVNGRRFHRQTNHWVDKAPVFHQVVAFNGLGENAATTLAKGTTVTITGEFVDDSWQPEGAARSGGTSCSPRTSPSACGSPPPRSPR
ncbi:MAG TPA: single-stranded DNA-binding protein [Pseudonocardiaceae bacterium]